VEDINVRTDDMIDDVLGVATSTRITWKILTLRRTTRHDRQCTREATTRTKILWKILTLGRMT